MVLQIKNGECSIRFLSTSYEVGIHPKSGSPGSPDSANYLNFPQNYSQRTRKLINLLCGILSHRAKAFFVSKCCKEMPQMSNEHVLGFRLTFSTTFVGLFFNDLRTFVATY